MSIKISGGHRIDHDKSGAVFVTDDCGDRGEVDRDRDIMYYERAFHIPIVGGYSSPVPPEEAFVIAEMTHQIITAGARQFRVTQVFGEGV